MAFAKSKMRTIIQELEIFENSQSYHIRQLSKQENVLLELIKKLKKESAENKDNYSILGSVGKYLGLKQDDNTEAKLQNELLTLEKDNTNLLSEFENYKLKSEEMEKKHAEERDELLDRLDKRNRANEELLDLIGDLKEKLNKAEEKIKSNEAYLKNAQERDQILTDQVKEIENLKNENSNLRETYLAVQGEEGKLRREYAAKNKELDSLKNELENTKLGLENELSKTNEDIDNMNKSYEQLNIDMLHLKSVYNTVIDQKDELFRKNMETNEIIGNHIIEKETMKKQIKDLEESNAKLQSMIDSSRISFEQNMLKLKEQYENEYADRKYEYSQLKQKWNDLSGLKQTLDSKLVAKIEEIEQLVKIKRKQEEELSHTKSDIEKLKQKAQNLEKQLENESQELSKVIADNRNLREEKESLLTNIKQYKVEEKMLKEQLDNTNKLHAELEVSANMTNSKLSFLDKTTKKEKEEMTKTIDRLVKETKFKEEEISKVNAKNNSLKKRLQEYQETEQKLIKQENKLNTELLDRQKAEMELQESCKILKMNISNMEASFNKKERELLKQIESLEKELEEKEQTNLKLNKSRSSIEELLQVSKTKEINMTTEISSIKMELSETKTTLQTLEQSNNDLRFKLDQMEEKATKISKENEILSTKYEDNKQKLDKTVRNLNTLSGENNQLQAQLNKLQIVNEDKERKNEDLLSKLLSTEKQCKDLTDEIEKLTKKPRKHIELSVFSSMKPGLTDIAVDDLRKHLQKEFEKEDTDFTIQSVVDPATIKRPAVVLCISISRLGADVQEALRGIRVSPDVAIIIFHHKEAHALPSQSSEKILTGSDYKQLGSIIDMAVLSSRGIYKCDMNDLGFKRLFTFLKRFSVSKK